MSIYLFIGLVFLVLNIFKAMLAEDPDLQFSSVVIGFLGIFIWPVFIFIRLLIGLFSII